MRHLPGRATLSLAKRTASSSLLLYRRQVSAHSRHFAPCGRQEGRHMKMARLSLLVLQAGQDFQVSVMRNVPIRIWERWHRKEVMCCGLVPNSYGTSHRKLTSNGPNALRMRQTIVSRPSSASGVFASETSWHEDISILASQAQA